MCTVTILPMKRGDRPMRLWCNRDELRTRPEALPPETRAIGDRQVIMPVDPGSGGTWIAANDAGLVMTVLNVNLPRAEFQKLRCAREPCYSRGLIIPSLMHYAAVSAAMSDISAIDPTFYAPFRLLIADRDTLGHVHSNGLELTVECVDLEDQPWMFTSSGLGDARVEGPRRALFDELFAEPADEWHLQQGEFHRHVWPDDQPRSVCMSRDDARTVSLTTVQISGALVEMMYHPAAPNAPATDVTRTLELKSAAV